MTKKNSLFSVVVGSLSCAALISCSSGVKKADIPSTANPKQEIMKFEVALSEAVSKNIDVLAPSDYKNAVKMFEEAKSDSQKGENQEEILDDVRTGQGHLAKAYEVSQNRESKATGRRWPSCLRGFQVAPASYLSTR